MGNTWDTSKATAMVKHKGTRAKIRFSGNSYIVNYGGKKYYEGKVESGGTTKTGGELSEVEFTLCDGDKIKFNGDHIRKGKKVSKLGQGDFESGDEVLVYWSAPIAKVLYSGNIIEINEGASIANCKMGDGDESWLPLEYIHKFVAPDASDF